MTARSTGAPYKKGRNRAYETAKSRVTPENADTFTARAWLPCEGCTNKGERMSKVLRLKQWVTIAEAATHISGILNENVSESDVLQFALNSQLRLSVNFVNHTKARCGIIVGAKDVTWKEMPALTLGDGDGGTVRISTELQIDEDHFLRLDDRVVTLTGVWDLPLIGNDRIEVERQIQDLIGGPEVELISLLGTFVSSMHGRTCQLQDNFETHGLCTTKQDQNKFERTYFPAGGLPDDGMLVVRTEALLEFIAHVGKSDNASNGDHLSVTPSTSGDDGAPAPYDSGVDWTYALHLDMWGIHEGIFYLLGINPDGKLASMIEGNVGFPSFESQAATHKDPLPLRLFSRYRESAMKSIAAGVLRETIHRDRAYVKPQELVLWALDKELPVVEEVRSLIQLMPGEKLQGEEPDELRPKERRTWAQIVKVLCAAQGIDLLQPLNKSAEQLRALGSSNAVELPKKNETIANALKHARDID